MAAECFGNHGRRATEAGDSDHRLVLLDAPNRAGARKVSGWPKRYKLAHAFPWEYSYKRLTLAQLLGRLGALRTCSAAAGPLGAGGSRGRRPRAAGHPPMHPWRCRTWGDTSRSARGEVGWQRYLTSIVPLDCANGATKVTYLSIRQGANTLCKFNRRSAGIPMGFIKNPKRIHLISNRQSIGIKWE